MSNKTEKALKLLFDFQRFEKEPELERIIRLSEDVQLKELSDDELSLVNAAGSLNEIDPERFKSQDRS